MTTENLQEPDIGKIQWPQDQTSPERLYMLRALWQANIRIDENTSLDALAAEFKKLPGTYVDGRFIFNTKELIKVTNDIYRFGLVKIDPLAYYSYQEFVSDHGRLSKREFDAQQKAAGAGQAIGWRIEVRDGGGGDTKAQHWFVSAGKDGARSLCGQVYGYMNRFGAYVGDRPAYCKTCAKLQSASQ